MIIKYLKWLSCCVKKYGISGRYRRIRQNDSHFFCYLHFHIPPKKQSIDLRLRENDIIIKRLCKHKNDYLSKLFCKEEKSVI